MGALGGGGSWVTMTMVFLNSVLSPSGSCSTSSPDLRSRSPVGPVREQHLRIAHERARDRDALLLAARQLARVVAEPVAETDEFERERRALAALGAAHLIGAAAAARRSAAR